MNKFKVTIEIDTYSADPEEWIIDAISNELEEDECLHSIKVVRTEF